jgi:hypothetical protein
MKIKDFNRGKRKVERGKWKEERGKWKVESGKRLPSPQKIFLFLTSYTVPYYFYNNELHELSIAATNTSIL